MQLVYSALEFVKKSEWSTPDHEEMVGVRMRLIAHCHVDEMGLSIQIYILHPPNPLPCNFTLIPREGDILPKSHSGAAKIRHKCSASHRHSGGSVELPKYLKNNTKWNIYIYMIENNESIVTSVPLLPS